MAKNRFINLAENEKLQKKITEYEEILRKKYEYKEFLRKKDELRRNVAYRPSDIPAIENTTKIKKKKDS